MVGGGGTQKSWLQGTGSPEAQGSSEPPYVSQVSSERCWEVAEMLSFNSRLCRVLIGIAAAPVSSTTGEVWCPTRLPRALSGL